MIIHHTSSAEMIACMKFVWKFKVQIHHLGADLLRMLSVGLQSSSHHHTVFSSSMLSILRDKSVRLARNLRATSARVARDSRATSARVARDSRYSQTFKKIKVFRVRGALRVCNCARDC